MAARVIHFGEDTCHRLAVLQKAGYTVDGCKSIVQLERALKSDGAADAVLITDDQYLSEKVLELARTETKAPVILFEGNWVKEDESEFDLVVAPLTPPAEWLCEIADVIRASQTVRQRSRQIVQASQELRSKTRAVVARSRLERARAQSECATNRHLESLRFHDQASDDK